MITRYEITAAKDGISYLIGYTPRVSRIGLLLSMQAKGKAIIERCGIDENANFDAFECKPRIHTSINGWLIGFTGRTEHDAKRNSHTYI